MVMTDDIVFAPASNMDSVIVPEGRWTLELLRIEPAPPSTFSEDKGPRAKWVFNLFDAQGELFYFNGEPYEFYRHTSLKNSPRAYARQYAEALLGRPLAEGEQPSKRDLIGRRMSALVSYDAGTIDPNQQVLKLSSLKPVAAPQAPAPKSAPETVNLDGLRTVLKKKIRQSEVLQSPQHLTWLSLNVDAMDADDLNTFIRDVQADLDAA